MTDTTNHTIVLVGHCTPDAFALTAAIRGAVPNATIERADSTDELNASLAGASLLMVNRVLDGSFPNTSGIDLISGLGEGAPSAMLISNLKDAQAQAEQAGAVPGFGKSEQRSERAAGVIRAALKL